MNIKAAKVEPVVFECCQEQLIGVIHHAPIPSRIGVLTVVAGGPQYRAGVGRGLVKMARELAAKGFAVMRFDYRGMGDSSGEFLGFEEIGDDLASAVDRFRRAVPELEHIVLWGGCDAASGIMIHAHALPLVDSLVIGNPWVSTRETQAVVVRQHYLQRLKEKSFWLKLLRMEYDLLGYARGALTSLLRRSQKRLGLGQPASSVTEKRHFIDRMLHGLCEFDGELLLLMSGRSIVSREFDELLHRDKVWAHELSKKMIQRIDLPEADQAFSSSADRQQVNRILLERLEILRSK